MGNICRSPAAEIIFHQKARESGLSNHFLIDSAGTIGLHQGNPPDHRMRHLLQKRGYEIFGSSRKIQADDLALFDHILVMDDANERDLRAMDRKQQYTTKIHKLTDFCLQHRAEEVPDPYYGGEQGFAHVIDLIEDACDGLLKTLTPRSTDTP